jgi:hypothetical protein
MKISDLFLLKHISNQSVDKALYIDEVNIIIYLCINYI